MGWTGVGVCLCLLYVFRCNRRQTPAEHHGAAILAVIPSGFWRSRVFFLWCDFSLSLLDLGCRFDCCLCKLFASTVSSAELSPVDECFSCQFLADGQFGSRDHHSFFSAGVNLFVPTDDARDCFWVCRNRLPPQTLIRCLFALTFLLRVWMSLPSEIVVSATGLPLPLLGCGLMWLPPVLVFLRCIKGCLSVSVGTRCCGQRLPTQCDKPPRKPLTQICNCIEPKGFVVVAGIGFCIAHCRCLALSTARALVVE